MGVTHGNLAGETAAIPAGTTITGIDERTGIVYLSSTSVKQHSVCNW